MNESDKALMQQAHDALIPLSNAHFPDERECLTDEDVRQAGRAAAALREAIAQPEQQTEQNFCARCGKRLAGDGIHTCTPPKANV